jgi:photosystem II stability/assembly factor-like uncharacterized protein
LRSLLALLAMATMFAAHASMPTWRGVEVRQFAQSATEPDTVYAIALTNGLLFRSDDRGRNWNPLRAPELITDADLHVDPNDARHVLLLVRPQSTEQKPSLHESFDRGTTWTRKAPLAYAEADGLPDGNFFPTRLIVPAQPGTGAWWAYDGRRFRSTDGGQTWVRQQGGPLPVGAVTAGKSVFMLDDKLLQRSADSGITWEQVHVFDSSPDEKRRTRGPTNLLALGDDSLVVRNGQGNWLQSDDGGQSWTPASNGFQQLDSRPALAVPDTSGFVSSGETWCSVLRSPAAGATGTLVARCTWDNGSFPSAVCLHVSTDAGRTWTPSRSAGNIPGAACQAEGLPRSWSPSALLLDAEVPHRMLVAWQAGGLYRSDDSGRSWQPSSTGLMFRREPTSELEWLAPGEPLLIQAVLLRDRELLQRSLAGGADINMQGNTLGGVLDADIYAYAQEMQEVRKPAATLMWRELRAAGATSILSSKSSMLSSAVRLKIDEVSDDLVRMGYDWGASPASVVQGHGARDSELHGLLRGAEHVGLTASRIRELIAVYIQAARFPSADRTTLDLLENDHADLAVQVMKASGREKPFDRQSTPRSAADLPLARAFLLAGKTAPAREIFADIPLASVHAHTIEASDFIHAIGIRCDLREAAWYKARGAPLKLAWHYDQCLSEAKYPRSARHRMLDAMDKDGGIPPEMWNLWVDEDDTRWVRKTPLYKAAIRDEKRRGTGVIGVELDSEPGSDYLVVIGTIAGLSAQKQGIRAGDKIQTVDGKSTELQSTGQVIARIAGKPGTWVQLGVLRKGQPLSFRVQRQARPAT